VAVEFAFLLPLFLGLLLGGIEVARAMFIRQGMQYAVEEGGRYALANSAASKTEVSAYALQKFGMTDVGVVFDTVIDGSGVTVTGSYGFSYLISGMLPDGLVTMTARSRVPR
jgi:Flp pilus assembly protein TadG